MMQFVIPIDKAIREFLLHLDVNPRTIFHRSLVMENHILMNLLKMSR